MHILMCLISGAQRKPRFSQATLKNGMDAFFNILLGSIFIEGRDKFLGETCGDLDALAARGARLLVIGSRDPLGIFVFSIAVRVVPR
jgi:hypothetical protein